jgi:hypothetical protein
VTPALLTPAANSQSVHNETKQLNTSWLHWASSRTHTLTDCPMPAKYLPTDLWTRR